MIINQVHIPFLDELLTKKVYLHYENKPIPDLRRILASQPKVYYLNQKFLFDEVMAKEIRDGRDQMYTSTGILVYNPAEEASKGEIKTLVYDVNKDSSGHVKLMIYIIEKRTVLGQIEASIIGPNAQVKGTFNRNILASNLVVQKLF